MPFLSKLHTVALGAGKRRLTAPLTYRSIRYGIEVTAPKGTITDGASVPRLPFIYLALGGRGDRAAAIHDYMYSSKKYSRSICDGIFKEALQETNGWFTSNMMWIGVRIGGWLHY